MEVKWKMSSTVETFLFCSCKLIIHVHLILRSYPTGLSFIFFFCLLQSNVSIWDSEFTEGFFLSYFFFYGKFISKKILGETSPLFLYNIFCCTHTTPVTFSVHKLSGNRLSTRNWLGSFWRTLAASPRNQLEINDVKWNGFDGKNDFKKFALKFPSLCETFLLGLGLG